MGKHLGGGRNLRLQSDGTGHTTVITLEDGTVIEGVSSAVVWLDAGEINRVELTFQNVKVDVHAELDEVTLACPFCSETARHDCPGTEKGRA